MKEALIRLSTESKALHQSYRTGVYCGGKGHEFGQFEALEGERLCGRCRRICGAAPPILPPQSPANLDARREVSCKSRHRETGEPCKCAVNLDRPESPPALVD